MAMKRVDKTGVYRYPDGSAVYLTEGTSVDERVLVDAELDGGASKDWGAEREPSYGGTVADAPQNQNAEATWSDQRAIAGAPENKAMSKPAEQKSDADLAADKAKK